MKNIWSLVLSRKQKEIILESFETSREAVTALKYRYILWNHLGANPEFSYSIKKVSLK
jgi:hypothetical protein|tara:strand:+ start:2526 stop:2699 length:174 start_codon:yes stop_codon:yes gene_type:complete